MYTATKQYREFYIGLYSKILHLKHELALNLKIDAASLECCITCEILKKTWDASTTFKHVSLRHIYIEKQCKISSMKCKNEFCVHGHLLCSVSIYVSHY